MNTKIVGPLFKKKYGVSKTTARNMRKKGLDFLKSSDLSIYRNLRKERKVEMRKVKAQKHIKARAERSSKTKNKK
jgi:hypothetical protein